MIYMLLGFSSYKHKFHFAIEFFIIAVVQGIQDYISYKTIEFGTSNHSTSNKESSRIWPLGRVIYSKGPSCYKVEHTLLEPLFPLWGCNASKLVLAVQYFLVC
jgi:hypothetical protein